MNRALCTFSLVLASSLVLLHAESAANDIVVDTCKKVSSRDLSYDFCVQALRSDPKSRTADLQGLGLVALNLLERNVTSTGSYVQQLLKRKWDRFVRVRLSDCSELYSEAVLHTRESIEAYRAKRYPDVQNWLSMVDTAADTCESQFKEKPGASSPLTKQNGDAMQLGALGLNMVAIIAGS
ncbi:putative invertase inhibitor [Eucalyptus grandis]|nr:putative invertase inhibitor [Eucalyptus grandis]